MAPLVSIAPERDSSTSSDAKTVFWHRDLPPVESEALGEHTVEAASRRVPGTLAHRDELWDDCYADLMAAAHECLNQEIKRLGGHFAHVLRESVDSRHDDVAGQAWLRGRFTYVLYRRPKAP